jgi:hypothetical protein
MGDDYYLYVVLEAATPQPHLYVVHNPAACLQPEEQHEVRYRVPLQAIAQAANAVTGS